MNISNSLVLACPCKYLEYYMADPGTLYTAMAMLLASLATPAYPKHATDSYEPPRTATALALQPGGRTHLAVIFTAQPRLATPPEKVCEG